MFSVIKDLKLNLFGLQSLIVLSVCLYYFVGMQISTAEDVNTVFLTVYKMTSIGIIASIFLTFFLIHRRSIFDRIATRNGLITLFMWVILIILTQQPGLIFMLIIAIAFYRKDYDRMAGYLFVWLSFLFILFATLASFGLINSGEMLKYNLLIDVSDFESVTALGMGNPNIAMAYFLGIVMSGAYIFYDTKYRRRYALIMLILALTVYSLVGSRTGLVCVVLFLILYFYDIKRIGSYLKLFLPLIIMSLVVVSIIVGIKFGQGSNVVNDFLTTRPYQWSLRLENGALTNILGNSDRYVTIAGDRSERYPLDNQYIYMIARTGWLPLLVLAAIYIVGSRRFASPVITYMIAISLIQSFVESLMFTAIVNIGMLFLLSSLMFQGKDHMPKRSTRI